MYAKDHRDAFLLGVPEVNPFGSIIPSLDGAWLAPIEFKPVGETYTWSRHQCPFGRRRPDLEPDLDRGHRVRGR